MDLIPVQIRQVFALGLVMVRGGIREGRLELLYLYFGSCVRLHYATPRITN